MRPALPAVLALGLVALAPAAARANLLTNPGFETGNLSGWAASGNVETLFCTSAPPGCPMGFGDWIATLNNQSLGVGNASLSQAVGISGPGTYEFGAMVSYGTILPAGGNFSQGQISLTAQVAGGDSETVGFDPNALSGQFTYFVPASGFSFTDWIALTGTLTYTGVGPVDLLININVQNFDASKPLALLVDNAFIRAAAVPEPASLALLGAGLLGLGALRRAARRA